MVAGNAQNFLAPDVCLISPATEGQLVGDYDKCKNEEEIIEMIKNGK